MPGDAWRIRGYTLTGFARSKKAREVLQKLKESLNSDRLLRLAKLDWQRLKS
jgi:hypothetical protein